MAIDIREAEAAWVDLTSDDHFHGQVVATCFAAMFEEKGWGKEAGQVWQTVNASQEIHLRLDPAHAFTKAIEVALWQGEDDLWHRANGLQQLVDPRLSGLLGEYLATPASGQFLGRLDEFVSQPIPYDQIPTKHELGSYPLCYLTFISTLLAHRLPILPGNDQIGLLKQKAITLLGTSEFQRIVQLYGTITDTKQFADELWQYLPL